MSKKNPITHVSWFFDTYQLAITRQYGPTRWYTLSNRRIEKIVRLLKRKPGRFTVFPRSWAWWGLFSTNDIEVAEHVTA